MTRILTAIALVALLVAPAMALTAQQEKMKDCNASASTQHLMGEARKEFMSACLAK